MVIVLFLLISLHINHAFPHGSRNCAKYSHIKRLQVPVSLCQISHPALYRGKLKTSASTWGYASRNETRRRAAGDPRPEYRLEDAPISRSVAVKNNVPARSCCSSAIPAIDRRATQVPESLKSVT
jgi:hypothetical protein